MTAAPAPAAPPPTATPSAMPGLAGAPALLPDGRRGTVEIWRVKRGRVLCNLALEDGGRALDQPLDGLTLGHPPPPAPNSDAAARRPPPARRPSITTNFRHSPRTGGAAALADGHDETDPTRRKYALRVGFDPKRNDLAVEIFVGDVDAKCDAQTNAWLTTAAILASICLQSGRSPAELAHAVRRDDGSTPCPIAEALRLLADRALDVA